METEKETWLLEDWESFADNPVRGAECPWITSSISLSFYPYRRRHGWEDPCKWCLVFIISERPFRARFSCIFLWWDRQRWDPPAMARKYDAESVTCLSNCSESSDMTLCFIGWFTVTICHCSSMWISVYITHRPFDRNDHNIKTDYLQKRLSWKVSFGHHLFWLKKKHIIARHR